MTPSGRYGGRLGSACRRAEHLGNLHAVAHDDKALYSVVRLAIAFRMLAFATRIDRVGVLIWTRLLQTKSKLS